MCCADPPFKNFSCWRLLQTPSMRLLPVKLGAIYIVKLRTGTLNPKGTVALAGRLLRVVMKGRY